MYAPALSARAAILARPMSDLASEIAYLLLDRERMAPDAFALALREYRLRGDPAEIGGKWRQSLVRVRALPLLRRLDRDLLDTVAPHAIPAAPMFMPAAIPPAAVRTTYVVAGPFDDAVTIDAFADALLARPGVRRATVALYDAGLVAFEVIDAGTTPLGSRLAGVLDLAPVVMAGRPTVLPWVDAESAA